MRKTCKILFIYVLRVIYKSSIFFSLNISITSLTTDVTKNQRPIHANSNLNLQIEMERENRHSLDLK